MVIIFTIWPGICLDTVFKTTFGPQIFASTSAMGELQHAPSSFTFSNPRRPSGGGVAIACNGLGLRPGLKLFLLFWDSSDCRTRCNSLMNSTTPPIIEAWSPLKQYNENKIKSEEQRERENRTQFTQLPIIIFSIILEGIRPYLSGVWTVLLTGTSTIYTWQSCIMAPQMDDGPKYHTN